VVILKLAKRGQSCVVYPLKTYIDQNQHLPEIPSEQEILRDGQSLGEMNRLLLKKVEELTLYLIELKAEVSQLQKQNNSK
jgi:hypothetical protein